MKFWEVILILFSIIAVISIYGIADADISICVEAHPSGGAEGGGNYVTDAAVGKINVTTSPSGAMVTIDRRDTGLSPWVFSNVPAGFHEVTVTHEGYLPYYTKVNVISNYIADVSAELTPLPTPLPTTLPTTIPTIISTPQMATHTLERTPEPVTSLPTEQSAGLTPIYTIIAFCVMVFLFGEFKR
jgi:hypothetical protein